MIQQIRKISYRCTHRLCPLSILLFSCGCVLKIFHWMSRSRRHSVGDTHTRVYLRRRPAAECRFPARRLTSQALTNQRAGHMQTRFRHAVVWLMLYVLGATIVTSIYSNSEINFWEMFNQLLKMLISKKTLYRKAALAFRCSGESEIL